VPSERYHIRVRGVQKTFGPHHVLRGIDLDIERGKINVIIGGSGQGKSVIMKHLMGLLKPDEGNISVDGEDHGPARRDSAQPAAQKVRDAVSVRGAVRLAHRRRKHRLSAGRARRSRQRSDWTKRGKPAQAALFSRAELHQIAVTQLDKLALPQVLLQKFPSELSGGQRKRVGLARALVMKPKILLYDEPTTGLDPVSTKNVDDMIRDVSKEHGVTSVIISHDMASTFRIGDRISALYGGVILESGPPEEFRRQSSQVAARVHRDERRGADDAL
jgi:phospholipid/cholesterol/gamma-HCH transport system ATP-binding protein